MGLEDKEIKDITLSDEITIDELVRILEIKNRLLAISMSISKK